MINRVLNVKIVIYMTLSINKIINQPIKSGKIEFDTIN